MKTVAGLLATIFAVGVATCASALTITNTSTSTTLFSESFENQTVGAVPTTANMTPGAAGSSWVPTTGSNATNATNFHTNNQASDGVVPYEGLKYLEIDRNNANGGRARSAAVFSAPSVGDLIRLTVAYYPITGYIQFSFNSSGSSSASNAFNLLAGVGGDHSGNWYIGTSSETASTLSIGTTNTWHTLTVDYTVGSTSVTISVDGSAPQTLVNADIGTGIIPGAVQVNANGSGDSHYYVDAVPEPAGIVLASITSVCMLGALLYRRTLTPR